MKDTGELDLHAARTTGRLSAGAALISRLSALGVDYIFANSGTDFPPIIEGLAEAEAKGMAVPRAVTIPHETAAMGMAHGYALATGRAQAVMVHTNVGLANASIGAINARADNVPMLMFSGRTPTTEAGRFGSRTVPIGWGQEMSDQHALIREACKWNYELRFPEQVVDMLDRAYGIAHSTPRGPVYMSLPREVLCESVDGAAGTRRPQMRPARTAPQAADLAEAARLLARAESPVIFAQRGAGGAAGFAALTALAEEWAIPVCQYWAVQVAIPTDHPMAASPAPGRLLEEADVVLAIDALAPWAPDDHGPRDDATVIQLGQDPLFAQTPVRNFRSDLSLPGEVEPSILALKAEMDALRRAHGPRAQLRRANVAAMNATGRGVRAAKVAVDRSEPAMTRAWISRTVSDVLKGRDASVFAELGCMLPFMDFTDHEGWFESPHAGGLGWGFPAAMGFKLAKPSKTVVATLGDGSYMFANPVACHQIAQALGISIVVLVMNNAEWGAVRKSVLDLYPDGYAARAASVPLTELAPSPDFAGVARSGGAWARKVRDAAAFREAFAEALEHVREDKGLALVEAIVAPDEHIKP